MRIIEIDGQSSASFSVSEYLTERRQEASCFASVATLLMGLLLAVVIGSWIVSVSFAIIASSALVALEISNSRADQRATRQETIATVRRMGGLRWHHG